MSKFSIDRRADRRRHVAVLTLVNKEPE